MEALDADNLTQCHICLSQLLPHPLYLKSGTMYCPKDGDFFVQRLNGEKPTVTFKPFDNKKSVVNSPAVAKEPPAPTAKAVDRSGRPGFTIRCEQTGVIFSSLAAASIAMGLSKSMLSMHLNDKRNHVGGYTFIVLDMYDEPPPFKPIPLVEDRPFKQGTKIRCNQTGEVFPSINAVARRFNINVSYIHRHLSGKLNSTLIKGYSFTIV